ncbi:sensor histidine kinase [Aromatoleum aromaticum]|uniref:histidine kinase n=1 Tax=Aromatoleum aromaticum (strain DSM 19018 / LMG 30748 / EbN1) TaxID=76114 RepID=Q5P209_AROAE|nr:HAMP domain-containing sensor histidine kinase [Aromatoleum aromaticum]NMG55028.1 HAMP domain-containing protein [Aromatoleum aromaticum]CAI08655.1 predicted histidine kinase-like ATPase [Aromatoleum aromaticum EbN1]
MRPPWPRTLFARLMLIWLVGIALVLAVSLALFVSERDRHGRDVLFEGVAREIAAIVDVLDSLPPEQREDWIRTLGRRRLRLTLDVPPPDAQPLSAGSPLRKALNQALPERAVAVFERSRAHDDGHPRRPQPLASVRLADGAPLTVRLPGVLFGTPPPLPPGSLVAALLALIAGVTLLSWLAVRIATRPLSRLAAAADALGADPNHPPIDTGGPVEVARAAHAFNRMQQRLQQHVGERTRILAAISHDLQTPITRLRLRAELVEDEAVRAKIQSDLDAMQALAKEGLDYARSLDVSAAAKAIDLNALVAALCEDAGDMGWQVTLAGRAGTPCHARLDALRRALWNLIENGVKFGGRVDVTVAETPEHFEIRVRDHGRGLPEAELEKVFEPFYRAEASRSRDTGGTGLGLAIARNLLRAQGGDVSLANRRDGGLEALVTLPHPGTPSSAAR